MTRAVLRKELATLWTSPLPYVAGLAFHLVFGVLVVNQLDVRDQAVLQPLTPVAGFLLLFTVPLLTMRSLAEEARTGTLEVLLAVPVAPAPIVFGKWLAAWFSAVVLLAPIGVVVGLVSLWGAPDLGPAVTGAAGLVLLAGVVAGIGVLASSLTASQPTAAVASMFAVLVLWFAQSGSAALRAGDALAAVSLSDRLQAFADGALSSGDAVFFVAATIACVVLASVALDVRRLR